MSIGFNKSEVKWVVEAFSDFFWLKGGTTWGKKLLGGTRHLFVVRGWNKRGRYLVMMEERGKSLKRIFNPEGERAGGWWCMMKSIFELAEVPLVNLFKKIVESLSGSNALSLLEQKESHYVWCFSNGPTVVTTST